jgi:hypothetical protein
LVLNIVLDNGFRQVGQRHGWLPRVAPYRWRPADALTAPFG